MADSPATVAENAGAITETVVEQALENAERREEAASEVVEQVVESARQAEIVRTVEDRLGSMERWHVAELSGLMERLSSAEAQLGLMATQLAETTAALLLLQQPPQEPQQPPPSTQPEPSAPEPIAEPTSASTPESDAPEPKPAPAKRRPSRRFW